MENYKKYHEEFMQNHNGTTSWETFSLIVPSFFELFIATNFASAILNTLQLGSKFKSVLIHFLIDFFIIVIPLILGVTILSNHKNSLLLTLLTISSSILFWFGTSKDHKQVEKEKIIITRKHFITNARSTINIITVIAILAVDFKIFPRRFAKTETYGYSLMDVGVGLFVFTNGIVAPEIKKKTQSIIKSIVSSIPLWLLGTSRFFITKEIDYQMHVSEYGVHWNFFITLAVTKILCSCILALISVKHALTISIFILSFHEFLLQNGLSEWVFSNISRDTFLTANREGIVSSLGYVGLYFLSVHFGKMIANSKNNEFFDVKLAIKLFASSALLLSSTMLSEYYFGISRRLANAGYCFWIMFIGIFMTSLFLCGENINKNIYRKSNQVHKIYVPLIYDAISFNGLSFFLLANILTGLVNICIHTLTVGPVFSFIIIVAYMFMTCGIITVLYVNGVKLKFF